MEADAVTLHGSVWPNLVNCYRSLFAATVIFEATLTLKGFFVNCHVLAAVEGNSSPGHISVIKGSSVLLHWNYTYIGDGKHGYLTSAYKEQLIGFSSASYSTFQVLAKRIGQNGALTLESPTPAPFSGRVEVISSNSTLVIHHLQYNDSLYQFISTATLDLKFDVALGRNVYPLKPSVNLTVNGIPDFISQFPSVLEVKEGSNLSMRIYMDGNPKPSADFNWAHRPDSAAINVSSVQLYPFVYSSTYSLNSINASYCGRTLQTTIKNSIGSSPVKNTNVTVLLNLDTPLDFKARKQPAGKCVEMKWRQFESGACVVKYNVRLKNTLASFLYTKDGFNIGEMKICNLLAYDYITLVQLTVSFKSVNKSAIAKVPGRSTVSPLNRAVPKFKNDEIVESIRVTRMNKRLIILVGSILLLLVIAVALSLLALKWWNTRKSGAHQIESKSNDKRSNDKRESRDIEMQARFLKANLSQAEPVPEYEEIV